MRIDAYTHFIPENYFKKIVESGHADIGKRVREIPCIHDLDIRRKIVDSFPDYAQILSYPMPPLEVMTKGDGKLTEEYTKLVNDGFADICAKYPDQFPGWVAQAALIAPDAGVREAERALKERRAWRADLHQYRRQAARRSRVRAVLCGDEPSSTSRSGCIRRAPPISRIT